MWSQSCQLDMSVEQVGWGMFERFLLRHKLRKREREGHIPPPLGAGLDSSGHVEALSRGIWSFVPGHKIIHLLSVSSHSKTMLKLPSFLMPCILCTQNFTWASAYQSKVDEAVEQLRCIWKKELGSVWSHLQNEWREESSPLCGEDGTVLTPGIGREEMAWSGVRGGLDWILEKGS